MEQRVSADGRVSLDGSEALSQGRYANAELVPTPLAQRNWTTYNYLALWVGMALNIPSYLLAAGMISLGMNWLQAFLIVTLGNLLVLIPMLLNSHAGTKYGIPYPVFARAFYGLRGANLAALLRAFVGCGWFGIQTWIGGQAIFVISGELLGDGWLRASEFGGNPWTLWLCFAAFFLLQVVLIWRGMDAVRRFESWAAPPVLLAFLALLVWMVTRAGGFGPIFDQPSQLGWGPEFWMVAAPSLMAMIAFWATLSLNMPDFTRFGRGQRQQLVGQLLGLPTTMSLIAIISIVVTSASQVVYGEAIWDPVQLARRFDSPILVIVGLVVVILATMTTNVAANIVSPSYDFSNAVPRLLSFRLAGVLACVVGVLMQPWLLLSDPRIYIYVWLDFYGGVLAAVAGVLMAGYWLLARTELSLADLYRPGGRYWFAGGWNLRALVATVLGALCAVGGAHSAPGAGPFPADGLIPLLRPLYSYSWVVGLLVSMLVFVALSWPSRTRWTSPPVSDLPEAGYYQEESSGQNLGNDEDKDNDSREGVSA